MVYQLDSYRYWESQLHRDDFTFGQFGENFTVEGLPDDEVCIGDRYRIGGALFEVTQPRVTCYRVGIRMDEPRMASLLVSHRRPGFYFRVLEEGLVGAGDEIVKVAHGPECVSVAEVDALLYLPGHPRDSLERALRVAALSPGWKGSLSALLTQPGNGNAGLTPASAPPPAWTGFRPLRVARIDRESASVVSFSFVSLDESPLPAALPGQSLIVKLWPTPECHPFFATIRSPARRTQASTVSASSASQMASRAISCTLTSTSETLSKSRRLVERSHSCTARVRWLS